MDVTLNSDQQAFARVAIADGRLRDAAEAVTQALAMWEASERQRIAFLATLDDAQASIARGEGRDLTEESLRQLTGDIQRRGRIRLAQKLSHTA